MVDFATIELASHAALVAAYNCGEQRRECGGVIYRTAAGRYAYTAPVAGTSFGVVIRALAEPPPAGKALVADYHNHVCSIHNRRFAEFFSAGDVLANETFHTIGYMLNGCTGNIRRFDPAQDDHDDEEIDFSSGRKLYLTVGHISGWIDIFN